MHGNSNIKFICTLCQPRSDFLHPVLKHHHLCVRQASLFTW